MEEWGENKVNSFKSCLKLKKHPVCFLGFIVLLFWGFFPSWEIFLKSKWRILASFILSFFFFFSSFLLPLFCFFDCCITSKYSWVWEGFSALSNTGGSFQFFTYLCCVLMCCIWIDLGTWCSVVFSSIKCLEYLLFFLQHVWLFSLKDEYNIMKITW